MATPRKKKTKPAKKAAAKRKPQPRKATAHKSSAPASRATSRPKRTAPREPSAHKPGAEPPLRRPASARERLASIKPSGGRDDSFFDLVHEVARQIPRGRVTSYGAIAACLGTRLSARMVGWAMNACHLATRSVPAHRVVNSIGLLTGRHHFNPPEKMQQLLEKEGVVVKNDKVVDFARLYWDPAKEL
jgi:methylated-DNA-protein-cysteine methyltransferase related protein